MEKIKTVAILALATSGVIGCISMSSMTTKNEEPKVNTEKYPMEQRGKINTSDIKPGQVENNKNVSRKSNLDEGEALRLTKTLLDTIYNNQKVNFSDEKALIQYLKETNNEDVYQSIIAKLKAANMGNENDDRLIEYTISLLAAIDSKRASELLFAFVGKENWNGSSAIYIVNKSISKLTRNGDYTDLVQQTYTEMSDENPFLGELSSAIARHANIEQVDYLISYVDSPEKNKSINASKAMMSINDESLVPHISSFLSDNSTMSIQSTALDSLANMGQYEAASALISWSANQPKTSMKQVEQLFTVALSRSPSTRRAIEKEANSQKFTSDDVRELIINMSNDRLN